MLSICGFEEDVPFDIASLMVTSRGSSWNRVGKIGVSGREHARARKRERTRKSVVTRPEVKVMMRA